MKVLITVVIIAGLAAVAGSVFIGVKSFDGTVTDSPYEKGLLWDEIQNKKSELDWTIVLDKQKYTVGENAITISLFDNKNVPLKSKKITVARSRPASASYDKYFDAVKLTDGVYRVNADFPLYGQWDLKITIVKDDIDLLYEKRVFAKKSSKRDEE
jgi:nitrogen fixation protein FixH